ncbi:hypothetical protein Agub_g12654, partial [Astrephomene gubernaculifera]
NSDVGVAEQSAVVVIPAFDLLSLFDSVLLPTAVLCHLDLNTRKLLRVCCKRLRAEVDACVTSLLVNRYNVSKLLSGSPGSLARRYPSLRRLAFGANEPRDVATLLQAHLPALRRSLDCLDFWAYYASFSPALWSLLIESSPAPVLRLRLNINESLLRRMELDAVFAALQALAASRPGLVVEFNTGHSFFGFRSTEAPTLRFLASAGFVRSLGFSMGLRGREYQNEQFFAQLTGAGADHADARTAAAAPAAGVGGTAAAAP